jgi:hypothetical protein
VPAARFQVLFPYSVDRDREAWRWSSGFYSEKPGPGGQTTGEMRKVTGKAAELAAILLEMPLDQDFFKRLEPDFLRAGVLGPENRRWVGEVLHHLPLVIRQDELRGRITARRAWYAQQLAEFERLEPEAADQKTEATVVSLFAGWRDPVLRRLASESQPEPGVPLRAILGYLFGEAAKNFWLIHHPEDWIEWVSRSQWGDRCFELNPEALPDRAAMMTHLPWEKALEGPKLMERWLERFGAQPFDYNRGLSDTELIAKDPPEIHLFPGTNFFRGLALIDLVEAMLKRAFGSEAVAVRINAAGQGDFFQVHVDTLRAAVGEVKDFIRTAFYRRFGLRPEQDFVHVHPGGGAFGVRLARFDQLPDLARALGRVTGGAPARLR